MKKKLELDIETDQWNIIVTNRKGEVVYHKVIKRDSEPEKLLDSAKGHIIKNVYFDIPDFKVN